MGWVRAVDWVPYQRATFVTPAFAGYVSGHSTFSRAGAEVLTAYKDKVRFCYKHLPLPFHPWAEPGAIAMECAEAQSPEAGWAVYDGYFKNQKDVTPANVKDKALEFAAAQKLDKAKFDKCFDGKETAAKVKADKDEAASLGLSGTPSFVINGRMVKGAQPAANFKAVIDDELAAK